MSAAEFAGFLLGDLYKLWRDKMTRNIFSDTADQLMYGFANAVEIPCPQCKKYESWSIEKATQPILNEMQKSSNKTLILLLTLCSALQLSTVHAKDISAHTCSSNFWKAEASIRSVNNSMTPENFIAALTQSFTLCKLLAALPNTTTSKLNFICVACGNKNFAAYFLGTLAAHNHQEQLTQLNNLLSEPTSTTQQLQQSFLSAINETQEPCQVCKEFKQWTLII